MSVVESSAFSLRVGHGVKGGGSLWSKERARQHQPAKVTGMLLPGWPKTSCSLRWHAAPLPCWHASCLSLHSSSPFPLPVYCFLFQGAGAAEASKVDRDAPSCQSAAWGTASGPRGCAGPAVSQLAVPHLYCTGLMQPSLSSDAAPLDHAHHGELAPPSPLTKYSLPPPPHPQIKGKTMLCISSLVTLCSAWEREREHRFYDHIKKKAGEMQKVENGLISPCYLCLKIL